MSCRPLDLPADPAPAADDRIGQRQYTVSESPLQRRHIRFELWAAQIGIRQMMNSFVILRQGEDTQKENRLFLNADPLPDAGIGLGSTDFGDDIRKAATGHHWTISSLPVSGSRISGMSRSRSPWRNSTRG